jgi:hypothetical protein
MVYNGKNRDDTEFEKKVAGSLCTFVTANQWFVEIFFEQMQYKNLLVGKLQDQILTLE